MSATISSPALAASPDKHVLIVQFRKFLYAKIWAERHFEGTESIMTIGSRRFKYVGGRLISTNAMHEVVNPESPLAPSVAQQEYAFVPEFQLESGITLYNVRVAYTTHGDLNSLGTNVVVVCHALTGSADAKGDWWTPLFEGPRAALDRPDLFVICLNVLGSPYGTTGPLTCINDDSTRRRWGPDFPRTSIRDDVRYVPGLVVSSGPQPCYGA